MNAQVAHKPVWRQWRLWLPVAALVVVAAFSMWRLARATAPAQSDWAKAATVVAEQWQATDAVLVAPAWLEPVARMHITAMASVDAVTTMDLASAPRAWLISPIGYEARGKALLVAAGFAARTPSNVMRAGALIVQLYEQAPAIIVDRLLAHATGVVAEVGEAQGRGYAPKRCALLVPPPGGQTELVVDMTLGSHLVGYVGLADVFTRREIRTPGQLRIEQIAADGTRRVLVEQTAAVDDGWVRFAIPTTAGATKLAFVALSPAPAGRDRRLCFTAEARQ